jgi:predicted ATP-binding protein involved in virulence
MRIEKLEINHIGPFEKAVLDFNRPKPDGKAEIHIFTGQNGSGKSTILHLLAGLFYENTSLLKRCRLPDSGSSFTIHLDNLPVAFSCGAILWRPPLQQINQELYEYSLMLKGDKHFDTLGFAVFAYSGQRKLSSSNLEGIKELTSNPLEHSLDFMDSTNPLHFSQWIANKRVQAKFADGEGGEEYTLAIQRIEKAIEKIIDYPVEFYFDPKSLSVKFKSKRKNENVIEFDVLPDGLKSIVSWIGDLLMRMDRLKWLNDTPVLERNFILLLDEIEIHLHPAWQRRILPVVQELFPNAQIFIATHSPFVVASVEDAWVHKLKLDNGYSRVEKVYESTAGESYMTTLSTIFDIDEYFDVETEEKFKTFYSLRDKILAGDESQIEAFRALGNELAERGIEVSNIIGREFRQLERIKGKVLAP